MGLRGRSAAGTRNWLGGRSRLRTYGGRSTYGSSTWKRQPSRPLAELHAPPTLGGVRKEEEEQGEESSSAVFEILSSDSEDETATNRRRLGGGGGSGRGSSSVRGRGVGPSSSQGSSGFDVDSSSDSSNERPAKARSTRVPACQLLSLTSRRGPPAASGVSDSSVAPSELDKQPRPPRSPSPPPAANEVKSRNPSPSRGVGPRSGWSNRGKLATQATPPATAAATASAAITGARTAVGQRPGQTCGDVASRPPTGRPSKSNEAYESRVSVRPERSSPPVAVGRQRGRGASGGVGALRAPAGSGGVAKARVGGFKEPAARRVLGTEGSDREGRGLAEKTANHSVFDMDDEDDSD